MVRVDPTVTDEEVEIVPYSVALVVAEAYFDATLAEDIADTKLVLFTDASVDAIETS